MKTKVLSKLRTLYADKGLAKEELESLAEALAKNLKADSTDEEVSNAASGAAPYVEIMQKLGNRMVTSTSKKYEGYVSPEELARQIEAAKKQNTEPPTPPTQPQGMTPEEIQKLISDGIAAGLAPYKEKEEKERLANLLLSDERVKSVPEAFRRNYTLEKEDDLEAVASKIETEWAATKQSLITSGVFAAPPQQANQQTETDDLIALMQKANSDNK